MSLEDYMNTDLEFVHPKCIALSPGDVSGHSIDLFNSAINDIHLHDEIGDILSAVTRHEKRKKRNVPVSCVRSTKTASTAAECENQFSEKEITRLKALLSESLFSHSIIGNVINKSEAEFRRFLETCDFCEIDMAEVVSGINGNTSLSNIQIILQKKLVNFKDMVEMIAEPQFDAVCNEIIKSDDPKLINKLMVFLKISHKTKLAKICASAVINPPFEVFYIENLTASTIQDVLSILLRKTDTFSLEESYAKLQELHAESLFQSQILQLSSFISVLTTEQVFSIITPVCYVCDVSPRCLLLLWCSLIKHSTDLTACNVFLSDLFKVSITQQNRHNFTLALILTRIFDIVGIKNYADSYQFYFGNSSTHITSSKSVEFVLTEFIKLVPFEIGTYLKNHIQLPLRGGTKLKDFLEQYMILAKTRIKDFNIQDMDNNVIHDVEKCISSFVKKGSVPSSIIEASIFKKQYYINHFLPCLLYDKNVSDDKSRQDLVDALRAANKIPKSVISKREDVQEITPTENFQCLISSLVTSKCIDKLKDKIYGLCCSGCDETSLKQLIRTVCIDCVNIKDIECVDFLKDFCNLSQIRDLFRQTVTDLILETDVILENRVKFLDVLELFDVETVTQILKVAILQNYLISKSIPQSIERDFLHLIVLGLLTEDIDTIIPNIVWKQVSVEKLCEALAWWPSVPISELQQIVIRILDKVILNQAPNEVCVAIFKSCLTHNILPLVHSCLLTLLPLTSFSKLWVYEALAKVLQPLYQANTDKPVATIQDIFKNFFNVINVIKPSLLYRVGSFRCLDNLLSVLDSYKIYITTDRYVFAYPVVLTVIRALQDNKAMFNKICDTSHTFLISCICNIDKIKCFESCVKNNDMIIHVLNFLKKLQNDGVSSNDIPDDRNSCTYIGICWFQVFLEQHADHFNAVLVKSVIVEGYLTAMFYTYAKLWLSGVLKAEHLLCIGELAIRSPHYHTSYTTSLLIGPPENPQNEVISQHFSGYKSSKVFCLLYLGGLAQCCARAHNIAQHRDAVVVVTKKCYREAQRLVFDKAQTMKNMKQFVMSFTRQQDTTEAARALVQSITQNL